MIKRQFTILLIAFGYAQLMLTAAPRAVPSYAALEVVPFEASAAVAIPADFQEALMRNLVEELKKTGKFAEIFVSGQKQEGPSAPALRLTGTVTNFNKGSRTERYLVGFGAGKTSLKAHIKFVDAATGVVKLEADVDGKMAMGLMGGDSKKATDGLPKEAAKTAKNGL
jgi:hypothetical protein